MKVIRNEYITMWDIDDTLVMHEKPINLNDEVIIKDPIGMIGTEIRLRKNLPMIRLMKEEKARGSTIIVWSRGGYQWAENVIKALKLEGYVTLILSKPLAYFDDKPVEEWLKYRVYLSPDTKYKALSAKE
jgi:predicted phosphatase